jgi:hypothetical protein
MEGLEIYRNIYRFDFTYHSINYRLVPGSGLSVRKFLCDSRGGSLSSGADR